MKDKTNLNKISFLDGYKVILCSMVAVGHFYNFLGGRYIYGVRLIGGMGARAVDGFFFITAFLTVLSLQRKNRRPEAFFFHRIKRLYPEYLPIILIAIITVNIRSIIQMDTLIRFTGNTIGAWGIEQFERSFPDIKSIILHLFFCNGLIPCQEILGVTWCLPIEVWFYFIVMLVLFFARGKEENRQKLFTVLFIVSFAAGIILFCNGFKDHQHNFVRSLPVLFTGVMFSEMYIGNISRFKGWLCSVTGLFYLFILDVSQNWMSVGIILVLMVMLLTNKETSMMIHMNSFLSIPFFRKGCELSYSIYLIHTLIIAFVFGFVIKLDSLIHFSSNELLIAAAFLFSVIFTIAGAWAVHGFGRLILQRINRT